MTEDYDLTAAIEAKANTGIYGPCEHCGKPSYEEAGPVHPMCFNCYEKMVLSFHRHSGVNGDGNPHVERLRTAALTTEQLKELKQPPWLVDGILQADSLAEIYGKPGAYKSFITVAWALSVATGIAWNGARTRPGPVIYFASEGAHGMGRRVTAWEQSNSDQLPPRAEWAPLTWLPLAMPLGNPVWGEALGLYAAEVQASLVVIDTRARNTVGLEENSAKDMGIVVAHLDQARSLCRACILLVHHANAFGDKSRGSTAVEGAVDTEVSVKEVDGLVTVKLEKQKNGPDGQEWVMKPVASADSVTLQPAHDPAGGGVTRSGRQIYEALVDITIDEGVSYTRWRESCDTSPKTFARQVKALVERGYVIKDGKVYTPRGAVDWDDTNEQETF